MLRRTVVGALSLPLAVFFGFVGWHKSVDNHTDLTRYGSWTAHLPEWLGRIVGWSELACAATLLIGLARPVWGRVAASVLIANQIAAALTHATTGEVAALPQNFVLIVMLATVTWAHSNTIKKGDL